MAVAEAQPDLKAFRRSDIPSVINSPIAVKIPEGASAHGHAGGPRHVLERAVAVAQENIEVSGLEGRVVLNRRHHHVCFSVAVDVADEGLAFADIYRPNPGGQVGLCGEGSISASCKNAYCAIQLAGDEVQV